MFPFEFRITFLIKAANFIKKSVLNALGYHIGYS